MTDSTSRSFFAGVESVLRGQMVRVTVDSIEARTHWNPAPARLRLRDPREYAEALRAHLDRAVRAQLRVTGDIGAYLSGGWDSGAVTVTAARAMAPATLIAFTGAPRAGYDGPTPHGRVADESELAAMTAALEPNIAHVTVRPKPLSLLANLDLIGALCDQPFPTPNTLGWFVALWREAQARNIKLLLSGFMGNSTISYGGEEALAELFHARRWGDWLAHARARARNSGVGWPRVALASLGGFVPDGLWQRLQRARGREPVVPLTYSAINPTRLADLDTRGEKLSQRPYTNGVTMRRRAMAFRDLGAFTKGVLGGFGLDQRDPTADRRLVEFSLSVPTEDLRPGRTAASAEPAGPGRSAARCGPGSTRPRLSWRGLARTYGGRARHARAGNRKPRPLRSDRAGDRYPAPASADGGVAGWRLGAGGYDLRLSARPDARHRQRPLRPTHDRKQ